MSTRVATALAGGSAKEAAASLTDSVYATLGDRPQFAFVFASTKQPLGELLDAISDVWRWGVVLIGASTAGEFTEKGVAKGSAAIFAIRGEFRIRAAMADGLKADVEKTVATALKPLPYRVERYPYAATVMLVDPLAGKGEEASLLVGARLGETTQLVGGAAGDDLHMRETFVGLHREAKTDALVLASIFSKRPFGVGVSHGHVPISEPVTITRSEGNVVYEIDNKPAWSVWAEKTRVTALKHGIDPDRLSNDEIPGFLLRYEAGLATGEAYKIRAPLNRQQDGSLVFACGIPEGSVIRITESEPSRQVSSAREAARRAKQQLGGPAAGALVFDCICRNLILGDSFATAVKEIANELGDVPIAGFETYGEIALNAGDMSGFHNTTTVVLAFPT